MFVPIGQAINPITQNNWEGRGVTPDIAVEPEEALDAAYKLALEAVLSAIGEPASRPVKQLLQEVQGALDGLKHKH